MPTVSNIIDIAKLSQAYCLLEIKKQGLYGGGIDLKLPRKLYNIRRSIEWLFSIDPTNSTLQGTANYLYALCAPFNLKAEYVISQGSGGTPVTPIGTIATPKIIYGSDFSTATDWAYLPYANKNLTVFSNGIADYLEYGTQWIYIPTGIRIIMPGFDSALMDYFMVITIIR